MCNCRNEVDEKVKEVMKIDNGYITNFDLMSGREFGTFEYTNEKGKRKKQLILYSHCPHCGEKYQVE